MTFERLGVVAMSEPAKDEATYEDLLSVPENMIGEIIDGELVVMPRPSRRHGYVASSLGAEIVVPYQFGRGGGPGGWVFIDKPEIQLGKHTFVPDLAGWKRERFPVEEDQNQISVVPDWVCEILIPDNGFARSYIQDTHLCGAHGFLPLAGRSDCRDIGTIQA